MPGPKNNPPATAPTPAAKPDPGRQYLLDLGKENAAKAAGTFVDNSGLTGISAAAAEYPAFATLMAIPEVANLLHQASVEGWTNDQFTLHLMTTSWWKSKSDTERVWEATKLSDPAKAAQQKNQMFGQVNTEAQLLGVPMDTNQLNFITEAAVSQGWNATQIQQALAGNAQYGQGTGSIAATQMALHGIASDYGVPISGQAAFDWAKKVASGTTDTASFTDWAKDQAKLSHPYWAKQLDEGHSLRQLADPYIQNAARLMEIDPSRIDLSNPKWSFTQTDKTGAQTPMSQLDWQKKVMTDSTFGWDKTQNAQDSARQVSDQIRQTFGAA